jgi:hypothetical protein
MAIPRQPVREILISDTDMKISLTGYLGMVLMLLPVGASGVTLCQTSEQRGPRLLLRGVYFVVGHTGLYMCPNAFQMTHIREKSFLNQLEFALIWSNLVRIGKSSSRDDKIYAFVSPN